MKADRIESAGRLEELEFEPIIFLCSNILTKQRSQVSDFHGAGNPSR